MNLTQEDSPMSQPTDHTAVADEGHPAVVEYIRQIPKLVAITALTMTVALIGNLFLAFIIATSTRRRLNPVQILIIHTCIADIMFALCTILPQLATFLTFPIFYGNDFLCRCVKYLQVVPMYASPNLLMAISIDRYLAICKPLKAYRWKYHLCQWLAFSAWLLAFLLASPQIVTFQYGTYTNSTIYMCISAIEETWVEDLTITFFTSFAWLIPSIVVGVLYTLVCLQVWRSNKHCATPEVTSTSANNTTSRFFPNNDTNNGQSSHHHQSTKQHDKTTTVSLRKVHSTPISFYKIRTVKLTMTIVACNFLLMAPFCLINLLSALFPSVMETIDPMTITLIMLVGNLNSCVNPWIYLIYNYKQVWKTVFNSFVCTSATQPESQSTLLLNIPSPRSVNGTPITTTTAVATTTTYSTIPITSSNPASNYSFKKTVGRNCSLNSRISGEMSE